MQNNAIYDDKLVKYDSENKVLKKSLKEKEDIIMNQNEISKKQKYLMDRMEKDIAILKE